MCNKINDKEVVMSLPGIYRVLFKSIFARLSARTVCRACRAETSLLLRRNVPKSCNPSVLSKLFSAEAFVHELDDEGMD